MVETTETNYTSGVFWSFLLLVDCQSRLKGSNYPLQFSSQEKLLLAVKIIGINILKTSRDERTPSMVSLQTPILHSGVIYGLLQI